jgi:hypothetical protein
VGFGIVTFTDKPNLHHIVEEIFLRVTMCHESMLAFVRFLSSLANTVNESSRLRSVVIFAGIAECKTYSLRLLSFVSLVESSPWRLCSCVVGCPFLVNPSVVIVARVCMRNFQEGYRVGADRVLVRGSRVGFALWAATQLDDEPKNPAMETQRRRWWISTGKLISYTCLRL